MKRIVLVLVLALICTAVFAQEGEGLLQRTGIMFGFGNLLVPNESDDGYQSGVGMKGWLGNNSAVRALLFFELINDTVASTSQIDIGLAGGYEHHFTTGEVSPYLGALAGTYIALNGGTTVDLYFGGLFGAEFAVLDVLSVYGEYNLMAYIADPFFVISAGGIASARFGFIIYF